MLVVGLGFLMAAVVQEQDLRALQSRGLVADALVLEESGGRSSYIDVRFTARSGEVVEFETGNYVEPVDTGDTIRVVYDRDDPYTFQHEKWGYSRDVVALCGVLGLAMFALGSYIAVRGVPAWMDRG